MKNHFFLALLLFTSCETTRYVTNTEFYTLEKGMTEKEFLKWIEPAKSWVGGKPNSVKLFSFRGDEWKVYCYDVYRIAYNTPLLDHREYAAFKNGRLEEYGTGDLPITLRQNPNTYTIINR